MIRARPAAASRRGAKYGVSPASVAVTSFFSMPACELSASPKRAASAKSAKLQASSTQSTAGCTGIETSVTNAVVP